MSHRQSIPARTASTIEPPPLRGELLAGGAIVAVGVAARLVFVAVFPAQPVSDFQALTSFGLLLRDGWWTAPTHWWDLFSPGLPSVLALLFRLPADPVVVARTATAVATGLMCLLPLLLWRGVVADRPRRLAALVLALWPGQIAFSGVVAQDNWVLLPAVALAALAVRVLRTGHGHPLAAAAIYVSGVAVRQEMLVVLLPAAIIAGGALSVRRARDLAWWSAALVLLLSLLAAQRWSATGRFAVTSRHGALAALGAVVPGASINGWADPMPHVAAVAPRLLDDAESLRQSAGGLLWAELRARPAFHLARVVAQAADLSVEGEIANTAWSLYQPGVLDGVARARADRVGHWLVRVLRLEAATLLALVAMSAWLLRRDGAAWLLLLTMAAKAGIHAVTVAQGRYYLMVTALGILLVGLGAEAAARANRREVAGVVAIAALLAGGVTVLAPRVMRYVRARDVEPVRSYHFPLGGTSGVAARFDCSMREGRLVTLDAGRQAMIVPRHPDPAPGERARIECRPTAGATGAATLRVRDPYAPGGFPDRIVQRVEVDGREVIRHDLAAEPGATWLEVELPQAVPFAVEVLAIRPDPGPQWGSAAATTIAIAPSGGSP